MPYDFARRVDRSHTHSVKWDFVEATTGVPDALPMWVADMDFETVPEIRDAVVARAQHLNYGYTSRSDDYYQAVVDWQARRHGWAIDRSWITHSAGVVNAIHTVLRALVREGEGVLIQPPVYHPFFYAIRRTGARAVSNPLVLVDGRYQLDLADFEAKLATEKPKVFILCNPHNPVGRVFTREELLAMGNLCLAHGVTVISDEIHGDLVYRGHEHWPLPRVSAAFEANTIVCTAASKTFNLAGLTTSNIIIPNQELRTAFDKTAEQAGIKSFNLFGSVACEAAYRHGEAWLDQLLDYLAANLEHARTYLARHLPQLSACTTEGTYFLWLDCRKLGLDKAALERFMLEKARLWFNQGHMFGTEGEGFVRINIACPRAILDEALSRLHQAVDALPAARNSGERNRQ